MKKLMFILFLTILLGFNFEKEKNDKNSLFGYRFIIFGDFNADGKTDTLTEHYFSTTEKRETNKFYKNISNYDKLVKKIVSKQPYCFISCNNKEIDTIWVGSNQIFGLKFLKNEGDLNGDGSDEISYVSDWADWSNINTYNILTYKDNKWNILYSFDIWDWQIPDLPLSFTEYGLFGTSGKINLTQSDSINIEIEKTFKNFKGLIKKIETNQIQIFYKNDEAMLDSAIINLEKIYNTR